MRIVLRTTILDGKGKFILRLCTANHVITSHFKIQFCNDRNISIRPDADASPLQIPVFNTELSAAFYRLNSARASGLDKVPGKLLKYGADILIQALADIINKSFDDSQRLRLGEGLLICLTKPNKPRVECLVFDQSSS